MRPVVFPVAKPLALPCATEQFCFAVTCEQDSMIDHREVCLVDQLIVHKLAFLVQQIVACA
jgi:hypothetical protein